MGDRHRRLPGLGARLRAVRRQPLHGVQRCQHSGREGHAGEPRRGRAGGARFGVRDPELLRAGAHGRVHVLHLRPGGRPAWRGSSVPQRLPHAGGGSRPPAWGLSPTPHAVPPHGEARADARVPVHAHRLPEEQCLPLLARCVVPGGTGGLHVAQPPDPHPAGLSRLGCRSDARQPAGDTTLAGLSDPHTRR